MAMFTTPRSSSLGKEVFAIETISSNMPSLLPFNPSYTAAQVRDILDRGADVNETICDGWTPLMFAAHYGADLEIIRTLVSAGADVNARDAEGMTALMVASTKSPDPEVIQALIDAGADVNAATDDGLTALTFAILHNPCPGAVQVLLDAGADPNAAGDDGWTPLFVAAANMDSPDDSSSSLQVIWHHIRATGRRRRCHAQMRKWEDRLRLRQGKEVFQRH